jgi:hypothetical protein
LDRAEQTRTSESLVHDLLMNWSWWCQYGVLGPPVQTQAASAEGEYIPELGDVYDPPEPHLEPNMQDGERIEEIVCNLPQDLRIIVKAKYIQYPYQSHHAVAQKLKISVDKFDEVLKKARLEIWRRWSRGPVPGLPSVVENSQRAV